MAPRLPVDDLLSKCISLVGSRILKYIIRHVNSCTFCKYTSERRCFEFTTAKTECLMPKTVAAMVHREVKCNWNILAADFDSKSAQSLIYFMITLFFKDYSFNGLFIPGEYDPNDMIRLVKNHLFEIKFSKKVNQEFWNTLPLSFWNNFFGYARRLEVLELSLGITCDSFFVLIGKYCFRLKKLLNVHFLNPQQNIFEKFCYKDFPRNTVKNKCCQTLEILHIVFGCYYTRRTFIYTGYTLLLENLPNLKYLGSQFSADIFIKHNLHQRCLEPVKIACVNLTSPVNSTLMTQVQKVFPKTTKLNLRHPSNIMQEHLITFDLLTSIDLEALSSEFLSHFLSLQPWKNLTRLTVNKDMDNDIICSFPDFSLACPNLEHLEMRRCKFIPSKTSRKSVPFQYLKHLKLIVATDSDFSWFHLISGCVVTMILFLWPDDPVELDENVLLKPFLTHNFPFLECLLLTPDDVYTHVNLKKLMHHCSNLRKFGICSFEVARTMEAEFHKENLDVEIIGSMSR